VTPPAGPVATGPGSDVPVGYPGADTAERMAVGFGRLLRELGIATPVGNVLLFVEALTVLGLGDRDRVYWAGRSTLVRRPEDIGLFDRAFAVFWEGRGRHDSIEEAVEEVRITLQLDTDDDDAGDGSDDGTGDDGESISLRFSAVESLRHKDFAEYTPDELVLARRLMADVRLVGTPRTSFRLSKGRNHRTDLRRTVRESLRTDGEPVRRRYLDPDERLRRLVLLLDVSGSMEPYARALVRFVHAAVAGRQKVEAFAIGTRLTRITRELSRRDPDQALTLAAESVLDWSGGTRLGECLRGFNDEWGVRGLARGAIVVILSDGWDRGAPEQLAEQMERLHRVTHKVVWVNPLKVTPGYAPLARGMAAALPHVDDFVEGHSVAAMEELVRVIGS